MRKIAPLLLLLSCGVDRVGPVPDYDCGSPCVLNNFPVERLIGTCHAGIWSCEDTDAGPVKTCVGFQGIVTETCDGLDNDCDGRIDEGVPHCVATTEVCNGIDDDLDGLIDEDLPTEYCYDGPPDSLAFGACHPGVRRCQGGQMLCVGQATPRAESCDGLDNDCDGQVDENVTSNTLDIVIVFDNSGSMTDTADALKAAVIGWATKYKSEPRRKYALVTAPDNDASTYGATPRLFQDFTDAATFAGAVGQQTGGSGHPVEATLDALIKITDPSNPLRLSWTPGARRIIVVFSDEEPQTDLCPATTTGSVIAQLKAGDSLLFSFSEAPYGDWAIMTAAAGGQTFDINRRAYDIDQDLDTAIQTGACWP